MSEDGITVYGGETATRGGVAWQAPAERRPMELRDLRPLDAKALRAKSLEELRRLHHEHVRLRDGDGRGGAIHATRAATLRKVTETLDGVADAVELETARLLGKFRDRPTAPSPDELAPLVALLAVEEGADVLRDLLTEAVKAEPDDSFTDAKLATRRVILDNLEKIMSEAERRKLQTDLEQLEKKRDGVLARLGIGKDT